VLKVFLPLILITLLNFLGFFVDRSEFSDRMANNITLFLSAFALLYVISTDIPKTSYTTMIDRFILVTIALLVINPISYIYEMDLTGPSPIEDAYPYVGFYLSYILIEFVYAAYKRKSRLA